MVTDVEKHLQKLIFILTVSSLSREGYENVVKQAKKYSEDVLYSIKSEKRSS